MKNERHLVSDNLDFDAGALDYKTRNNALIQIVIQATVEEISDTKRPYSSRTEGEAAIARR
jgi:hypothetical protein